MPTQAAGIPAGAAFAAYGGLPDIPYWENLFPGAAGNGITATQTVTRAYMQNAPDYITALYDLDDAMFAVVQHLRRLTRSSPTSTDSLAAISSIGRSNYNAMI